MFCSIVVQSICRLWCTHFQTTVDSRSDSKGKIIIVFGLQLKQRLILIYESMFCCICLWGISKQLATIGWTGALPICVYKSLCIIYNNYIYIYSIYVLHVTFKLSLALCSVYLLLNIKKEKYTAGE